MYSILFKNAFIIDGTGEKGKIGDIAIEKDKIANISDKISGNAVIEYDLEGKILAPGFIDIQNHSDSYWQIFDNPTLDSMIRQGFTSIIVGNCGGSLAPLLSHKALLSIQKWHNLEGVNINWQTFAEFLNALSKQKFSCNIGSLVGYSTLRRGIVGDEIRSLEENELNALKKTLKETIKAGAFGLSTGLSYSHEINISEVELYELAKIIKEQDALFSVHLRSEGADVLEAIDEALDLSKTTGVNLKISHFKIRNENNWNKFDQAVEKIESASHKGVNIHFDLYPYNSIWQPLYSYLPKWAFEGGRATMLKHFENPVQKNKILHYLNNLNTKFSSVYVASTANKINFAGKTIGQIAKNLGCSSEQAVLNLIQNGGSEVLVFEENLNRDQVENLLAHPLGIIASDGGGFSKNQKDKLVHPRCFGTTAKFLSFAKNSAQITFEQAISKLTKKPAKKLGLKNRGEIKIGNYADLVVIDKESLIDNSSYENPYQTPSGILQVFVNGKESANSTSPDILVHGRVLKKE